MARGLCRWRILMSMWWCDDFKGPSHRFQCNVRPVPTMSMRALRLFSYVNLLLLFMFGWNYFSWNYYRTYECRSWLTAVSTHGMLIIMHICWHRSYHVPTLLRAEHLISHELGCKWNSFFFCFLFFFGHMIWASSHAWSEQYSVYLNCQNVLQHQKSAQ